MEGTGVQKQVLVTGSARQLGHDKVDPGRIVNVEMEIDSHRHENLMRTIEQSPQLRKPSTMIHASESALLNAIAAKKDREAFAAFFTLYEKCAYNLACYLTRNRELAEEAVQEAMLSVWKSAASFQEGNVRGWVMRIVANKSLDVSRRNRREKANVSARSNVNLEDEFALPDRSLEKNEVLRALRGLLYELPVRDQRILALYYCCDLSQDEVAEALCLSQTTVSSRISQSLAQLRTDLMKLGFSAALPIMGKGTLSEAILTAKPAPSHLLARTVRLLDRPGVGGPAHTIARTTSLSKSSAILQLSGILVLSTAVVGGTVWSLWGKAVNPSTPTQVPDSRATDVDLHEGSRNAKPKDEDKRGPVNAFWRFTDGPNSELSPIVGTWRWKKEAKRSAGCMAAEAVDPTAIIVLPPRLPNQPFLVTMTVRPIKTGQSYLSSYWSMGNSCPAHRYWYWYTDFDDRYQVVVKTYYFDRYAVQTMDDRVYIIRELPEPIPFDRAAVSFGNWSVMEIGIRTIDANEIPAKLRDPKELIDSRATGPVDVKRQEFMPSASQRESESRGQLKTAAKSDTFGQDR